MKRVYYLGLIKGSGAANHWPNGHSSSTLIVQARPDLDSLSCELWQYYGPHKTTKKELQGKRAEILAAVNAEFGTSFTRCVID